MSAPCEPLAAAEQGAVANPIAAQLSSILSPLSPHLKEEIERKIYNLGKSLIYIERERKIREYIAGRGQGACGLFRRFRARHKSGRIAAKVAGWRDVRA